MNRAVIFGALVLVAWSGTATAQAVYDGADCGDPFDNAVGPWDYNNSANFTFDRIPVVERYHFNSDVERLVRGQSAANLVEDLDYVLRAVPNHPRALYSIANYQLRTGKADPKFRSAECYFDRALRFSPQDPSVPLVLGIYRAKKGDREGALEAYKLSLKLAPNSPEAHYNMGLLYFDLKKFDEAREHAKTAYKLGYPLPGLRQMLQRAGLWTDTDNKSKSPQPTK